MLNDRQILITGGTGSFGTAATEFLLKECNLKKLIIFSRDENKQFQAFPQNVKFRDFKANWLVLIDKVTQLSVFFKAL